MPGADEGKKVDDQKPGADDGDKGKQDDGKKPDDKKGDDGKKEESGELDLSKLDPKAQKLIKDLRTESASHRSQNKNLNSQLGTLKKALVDAGVIEDDSEKPEEKIKSLSEKSSALEFRSAILESALEHGVSKDGLEYFEFLVSKRASALEEGQELTDEILGELASQVIKQAGGKSSGAKSTSVGNGDKGANPPPPGDAGGVTLDQFVKMNITEKSQMYIKTPELYNQLHKEAKEKKLLI